MPRASFTKATPKATGIPTHERAIMALEAACVQLLDAQFTSEREDVESLLVQRKLKNIVSRISLALRECKGPRHFHQHYRHREEDDSVLTPVLDDPLETLSQVCQSALAECQCGFSGVDSRQLAADIRLLERAIRHYLDAPKPKNT